MGRHRFGAADSDLPLIARWGCKGGALLAEAIRPEAASDGVLGTRTASRRCASFSLSLQAN